MAAVILAARLMKSARESQARSIGSDVDLLAKILLDIMHQGEAIRSQFRFKCPDTPALSVTPQSDPGNRDLAE